MIEPPEDHPFPWVFPFAEDPTLRLGRTVLRPVVDISFRGLDQYLPALIDSGCEHILVPRWVGRALQLDLQSDDRVERIGLGGAYREVRFFDLDVMVRRHLTVDDARVQWTTEVGVICGDWEPPWALLGQRGFFDRFTVTINREIGAVALEGSEAFEERYGPVVEERRPAPPADY